MNVKSVCTICFIGILIIQFQSSLAMAAKEDLGTLSDILNIDIITATKTRESLREAPAAVYVITARQIQERGYRTLVDALHDVPGFDIHHMNGLMPDLIHQRGMYSDNQRSLLYINGIPDNNLFEGAMLGGSVRFPLHNVQQIEVVSGPASALYGANAFNGVINIVTKDGEDEYGLDMEAFGGTWMDKDYYGFGGSFSAKDRIDFEDKSWKYSVSGYYYKDNGPDFRGLQDLKTDNSGYWWSDYYNNSWEDTYNVTGNFSDGKFRVQFVNWQYLQGDGTTAYGYNMIDTNKRGFRGTAWNFRNNSVSIGYLASITDAISIDSEVIVRHTEILNSTGEQYPSWEAEYNYYGDPTQMEAAYSNPAAVNEIYDYARPDYSFEIKERMDWKVSDEIMTMLGLEALYVDCPEDYATEKRYSWKNYGAFGQIMYRPSDILGFAGAYRFDSHTKDGEAHTPRFSVVATPGDLTLKALFSTGFRAPNIREKLSTTEQRKANPDGLSPEKLVSGELGLNYRFSRRFLVGIHGYYNRISDLILEIRTTDINPATGDYWNQIQNVGTATVMGIEAQTDIHVLDNLNIYANYTYIPKSEYDLPATVPQSVRESTTIKDGDEIPNIAKHKFNCGITYYFMDTLSANVRLNYVGERKTLAVNTYSDKIDAYYMLHANIRWEDALTEGLYLQLTFKNILDAEAFDPGMRSQSGWWGAITPIEGRNIWLTVGYRF